MSEYKIYMIIVFNGMNKLVGKAAVTSDRTTKDEKNDSQSNQNQHSGA